MRELDDRARQLLDIARTGHNPGPRDAARVRAALKARVLAEPALLQVPPAPPVQPSLLRKLALAFGAGGGAGFVVGLYVARALTAPALTHAPAAAPPVMLVAPTEDTQTAAEPAAPRESGAAAADPLAAIGFNAAAEVAPRAAAGEARRKPSEPSAVTARSVKAPAESAPNPLKAELDGLRRAQELLHQGQPAWAVARLNELDRAQVGSVLLEERLATRAIAECELGRAAAAQIGAFEQRFPRSAHLEQVRASCSAARRSGTTPSPLPARQTENAGSDHE